MNYLIGDIGNTNIKICKINRKFKIIKTYLFETKNPSLDTNLNRILKQIVNYLLLLHQMAKKLKLEKYF